MNLQNIQIQLVKFILFSMYITGTNGGYPGLFCGPPLNPRSLAGCNNDCIFGHNAASGKCGTAENDYNCYCDSPQTTVNEMSVQCWDPNVPTWAEICKVDCRCNHGALEGICNYVTHGCVCIGVAAGFQENRCPLSNGLEAVNFFNESYFSLGGVWPEFAASLVRGELEASKRMRNETV